MGGGKLGACAELCFGLSEGCEFAYPHFVCEYSECFPWTLCNKGQGSFSSSSAFLAVNAQFSFRSSSGIYQLTSSRSWEQPQLSFPPSSPEHPLPPALPHPAIPVPQGTLGCSSLSICPVLCAGSKASEETGVGERENSCPGVMLRQGFAVFCGGEPGLGL